MVKLTSKDAILSDGQHLTFDYAAICTGSTYNDAFKAYAANRAERLTALKVCALRPARKDVPT